MFVCFGRSAYETVSDLNIHTHRVADHGPLIHCSFYRRNEVGKSRTQFTVYSVRIRVGGHRNIVVAVRQKAAVTYWKKKTILEKKLCGTNVCTRFWVVRDRWKDNNREIDWIQRVIISVHNAEKFNWISNGQRNASTSNRFINLFMRKIM